MKRPDRDDFQQIATLCYIVQDGEALLIEKKRGVGSGLYNGPGGKIEEQDDSPREGARREVIEEVDVKPGELEKVGEIDFIFGEQPFQRVHVFRTDTYTGTPKETEEAIPEWFDIEEMPYDTMWEDDRYWMPLMFEGLGFQALFEFDSDGDELQDWVIESPEF
jgi:8-oxo-dGTP diphosphatase